MLAFRFALICCLAMVLGCAGIKTRRDLKEPPVSKETAKTEEGDISKPFGSEEDTGTSPLAGRRPKVGLILGPGGAKAFAHTGVIRELQKARIPIDVVVGLEWGALVGGLFAQKGQIHEAEWQLYKLEQKDFLNTSFLSSTLKPESVKALLPFIKKSLGKEKLENSQVPFYCPSLSLWSGTVVWQKQGPVSEAVERCLPYPPMFKPSNPWMAASFALKESVAFLKEKGMELILFINVLDGGTILKQEELLEDYKSAILWQELRRSLASQSGDIEVIHVITRNFPIYDFDSRRKIVMAGEQAGAKVAQKLADKYGF